MKRQTTIKGEIFKFNLLIILILLVFVIITFNITISIYLENQIYNQLEVHATNTASSFIQTNQPVRGGQTTVPQNGLGAQAGNMPFINDSDFILVDENLMIIERAVDENVEITDLQKSIAKEVALTLDDNFSYTVSFKIDGTNYAGFIYDFSNRDVVQNPQESIQGNNPQGLDIPFKELPKNEVLDESIYLPKYIITYTSLDEIKYLQNIINIILIIIFMVASIIVVVFSSYVSKRISTPISSLSNHIKSLSERDFSSRIEMDVDGELVELINHINIMSEKLNRYDEAQKNFLQNASHEFRTPLMSIQCYAEGIKYKVVDDDKATDVIISETKRLSLLVKDLLYLSRLDTIEETYNFDTFNLKEVIYSCLDSMTIIAKKYDLEIIETLPDQDIKIYADVENLTRAITNIISNGIRYARERIYLEVTVIEKDRIALIISDDGPGFDEGELDMLFKRFYKGKKGNYGLGLSITQNIILKHKGTIAASNGDTGAQFRIELPIIL